MWKVTFFNGNFVAGVLFNRAKTEVDAIESARLYFAGKYDRAIAERI